MRIHKQRTADVVLFEVHFGRQHNVSLSNKSTPQSANLTYSKISQHYLDIETNQLKAYLDERGRVDPKRSYDKDKMALSKAQIELDKSTEMLETVN